LRPSSILSRLPWCTTSSSSPENRSCTGGRSGRPCAPPDRPACSVAFACLRRADASRRSRDRHACVTSG
jgi:hypothetical protein